MRKIVFSKTDSCARLASSTRITANTIDARPRGPNQPRKATVGGLAPDPSIARATGTIRTSGQAQERIENDSAGEVVEHRYEHDGAEENERDRTEQAAGLLEEERHLASDLATQPSEDGAADEGGDEPAAAHPHGQSVRERGPCDRDDLQPDRIDEAARDSQPDHDRRREPRKHASDDSVADLLEHEVHRRAVSDRALVRLGNRDRDQEQRDADAVVEPALDIEALADARRNPGVGNDRLPERSVRRGEHDRKQHGLDERELSEHGDTRESAGHDRQRQPDREQAKRHDVLAAQCCEVDPRRIREEHDRQRRLGDPADGFAPDRRVEPTQNVRRSPRCRRRRTPSPE